MHKVMEELYSLYEAYKQEHGKVPQILEVSDEIYTNFTNLVNKNLKSRVLPSELRFLGAKLVVPYAYDSKPRCWGLNSGRKRIYRRAVKETKESKKGEK